MKCKLITTVSDPTHPGWLTLKRSLDKFGWDHEICGTGYTQFGSKMVNAYNYARTTDCTHLFIVDAYDVVVLSGMEEALSRISDKDVILFNSERNCWPYPDWAPLYPDAYSSFKYLNGGMAFVSVERFIKMFEDNTITENDNDQPILSRVFITNGFDYKMELDTKCEVFQTLCGTNWDEFDFDGGALYNKETETSPLMIHGNGLAPMDKIIELL